MPSSSENFQEFFRHVESALQSHTFIKLILSKPAAGISWQRIVLAAFRDSRDAPRISIEFFTKTQTERENVAPEQAFGRITSWLPEQFAAAHLKLPGKELMFERTQQGSFRLKQLTTSAAVAEIPRHNRDKHYLLSPSCEFLRELGITSAAGEVRREKYDKFRQIQKFIEILSDLIPESKLSSPEGVSVVDFGSGKNYLTFALHHFLSGKSEKTSVTGVEQRADLVASGEGISEKLALSGLHFVHGSIATTPVESVDLVVALHACDTASDDALAKAIRAKAGYICVAPCCHSYVRQRFTPSDDLKPMLRHGILAERFAEGLTDSLRVLMLEVAGYQTKLFEFISLEHTAKNVMITARFTGRKRPESLEQLRELKRKFNLEDFYLDRALSA